MKSVLISIQPKWCELIARGKKTVEVRKTRPKIETPFKCYVYCTKEVVTKKHVLWGNEYRNPSKNLLVKIPASGEIAFIEKPIINEQYRDSILNGKVIGEFVCDRMESIFNVATTDWGLLYGNLHEYDKSLVTQACLTEEEVHAYAKGKIPLYCWHISDLKIYDKPKELGEFRKPCSHAPTAPCYPDNCERCDWNVITRPPQSWCYVEEL